MPRGKPVTADQEAAFLNLVAQGNTVTRAAEQLGLTAGPFYKRLADDSAFAELARVEIKPQFRDRLEQALLDIALGRSKPTHASQVTALIIALKRYDPDYRESQQRIELTGDGGGPVEVTVEHDYGRLIDKLEQVGLLKRGPLADLDTTAGDRTGGPPLLPPPAD